MVGKHIAAAGDQSLAEAIDSLQGVLTAEQDRLIQIARALLISRHAIERFFDEELFGDPARDLLLEIYVADAIGRPMRISAACIASRVPQTTGLRWVNNLRQRELIIATPDPLDGRSAIVSLSEPALASMEAYLRKVGSLLA